MVILPAVPALEPIVPAVDAVADQLFKLLPLFQCQRPVGLPPYHIVDGAVSGINLVKDGVPALGGFLRNNPVVPDPVCRIGIIAGEVRHGEILPGRISDCGHCSCGGGCRSDFCGRCGFLCCCGSYRRICRRRHHAALRHVHLCHGHILAQQILLEPLHICPIQHAVSVGVAYSLLRKIHICAAFLHCLSQLRKIQTVHNTVTIPVTHVQIRHRLGCHLCVDRGFHAAAESPQIAVLTQFKRPGRGRKFQPVFPEILC